METNNVDFSKYNDLVKNVSIGKINLKELIVSDVCFDIRADSLNVNLDFEVNEYQIDVNKNNLLAFPQFIVKVDDDTSKKSAFKIEVTYCIEYNVDHLNLFDVKYIELFIKRNIPINIWPYARELISSITTKIGYPALVIEPYKG